MQSSARLVVDGLVMRYPTVHGVDGLPPGEGTFLPCTSGSPTASRSPAAAEADEVFERLIASCNDVGLLSEEYDPRTRRMMGNFPQALTHMALVNTARLLSMPGAHPCRSRLSAMATPGQRGRVGRRRSAKTIGRAARSQGEASSPRCSCCVFVIARGPMS
jgi:hypothetical protein